MDNAIIARVGTLAVTQSELDEAVASLGARNKNIGTPEGKKAVLEQLVANKLLLLDAQKNLLEYDPVFKAELKKVKEDLLVNFALTKALESVKAPTDEQAKAYYEENKDHFIGEETVSTSHILVDSAEKAQSVLDEINAGFLSFEDAARKYSSCPSSENGGNLGEFTKGQMVPEFDAAVFSMEVGEIKGPVKTQFGHHLIRLNAKNPAVAYTFEQIAPQIKELLYKENQQKAYQSKINQLKILYPVDML